MDPVQRKKSLPKSLAEEIAADRRRIHDLPDALTADEAAEARRRAMESVRGVSLAKIGSYALDAEKASTQHCENFIGAAQVPMGVVGPVAVRGQSVSAEEDVWVPLATTEGALLASVNRGCSALRAAGGAVVRIDDVGMTRAPAFRTTGLEETRAFLAWIDAHEGEIRRCAEATSEYLRLLEIRPHSIGSNIYLRFRFSCGDAMGMNMATIACDRVVRELIEPGTGVPCVALSGNYCVDKKPSAINFLEGRGQRIQAEINLDGSTLRRILKTDARTLVEVQYRKNLLGSIAAGAMGFNAHFANVVAAFFVACGQDVAQAVEGAMGVTTIEPRGPEGVYASVFLPDVPLGAIGGGTGLDTQAEALALMGIEVDSERPGYAVRRLAEILGATVLAGEISLLAALTSGDLAGAHERLGRPHPDE